MDKCCTVAAHSSGEDGFNVEYVFTVHNICDQLVTFPGNFGLDRSLTYLEKKKSKSKLLRYIF